MFPPLLNLLSFAGGPDISSSLNDFGNIANRLSSDLFKPRHKNGNGRKEAEAAPIGGAASNLVSMLGSLPARMPTPAPSVVPPPNNSGYALQGQSLAERRQVGAATVLSPKSVPLPTQPQTQFTMFLTKTTQALQKFILPVTKLTNLFRHSKAATGNAASSASGGAASMFGGLFQGGGDIAAAVKLIGVIVGSLVAAPAILKSFVGIISESNRELGMWDAKLAGSFAGLDILRTNLDIKTAGQTAETGSMLNEEFGRLLKELQPMRADMTNLLNVLGVGIAQTLREMVPMMKVGLDVLDGILFMGGDIQKALDALALKDKMNQPPDDVLATLLGDIRRGLGRNPNQQVPLPPPIGPRDNLPPILPPNRVRPGR